MVQLYAKPATLHRSQAHTATKMHGSIPCHESDAVEEPYLPANQPSMHAICPFLKQWKLVEQSYKNLHIKQKHTLWNIFVTFEFALKKFVVLLQYLLKQVSNLDNLTL